MSEPHLSVDDLNAFAARRLDASRVQEIFAHLSSCALCRDRSQQALDTDRSVDRLIDAVGEGRPARTWIYVLAACLAIAAVGGLLFLLRTQTAPPQEMPPSTIVDKPPTQTTPTTTEPPAPEHPAIAEALARGTLTPPAPLAALLATPATERVRGDNGELIATYEPNREVVATRRPHFRFPSEKGFPTIVRVFDRDREVLQSKPVESGQWTATSNLPRGVTYTWQVESTRNGETIIAPAPPAAPARFIVADDKSLNAFETALRDDPENHLLLGILSAGAGLREEALKHLRIATRESSDPRVRELLSSVENWPR